jgi:CDP-diacylglycerol--glycerol-3-phosphate 3-phosphatidyltransferase
MNRVFTISNILSLSRIVIVIPIAMLLLSGRPEDRITACGLILVGVATDFLDGYLARRLHQVSDLGKIIDPVADKIAIGTVVVILIINRDMPLWYAIAVLLRDLLILAGAVYIRASKRIVPQSNWPGKWAVTFISVYIFLCILRVEAFRTEFLWASTALMAISLAIYTQRLFIGRNVASA